MTFLCESVFLPFNERGVLDLVVFVFVLIFVSMFSRCPASLYVFYHTFNIQY